MRSNSLLQVLGVTTFANNGNALNHAISPLSVTSREPFIVKPHTDPAFGRRRALESILFGVFVTGSAGKTANALDMDAFASSTLENDQKNCDPKKDPKCIPRYHRIKHSARTVKAEQLVQRRVNE
jgi:hypothetical protein